VVVAQEEQLAMEVLRPTLVEVAAVVVATVLMTIHQMQGVAEQDLVGSLQLVTHLTKLPLLLLLLLLSWRLKI
jgi:hypothetical protein